MFGMRSSIGLAARPDNCCVEEAAAAAAAAAAIVIYSNSVMCVSKWHK